MSRSTLDRLVSWIGLTLAAVLVVGGGLLAWAHNYVRGEVHDQLAAQQIYFPAADSPSVQGAEFAEIRKYGGEQLTTGAQAKAYADHYIAVHLVKSGDSKTYAQLSTEARTRPDDAKLKGQVETMFKGETLRGLLLNAYAFDTMATVAGIAAFAAFAGAAVLILLAGLGVWHSRRIKQVETLNATNHERIAATA